MADPVIIPAIAGDGSLYPVEKMQAHRDGLLHLAVSVFLFDAGLLLIQKRAAGKYHCPGLWANTCCTHPDWGEALDSCASRRLGQELGLSPLPLRRHATVEYRAEVGAGMVEHERVTLFSGQVDRHTLRIAPAREEVSALRWVGAAELYRDMRTNPQDYTPWFRIYLERFPDFDFDRHQGELERILSCSN